MRTRKPLASRRRTRRRGPSRATLAAMAALAREARDRARAPYSRFRVGAALKTRTGEIVTGCNIENASYGLTMCAERVAVFKAVSEGLDDFDAIAVVADSKRLTPPCGPCRQILWEYCGDVLVHMSDLQGRSRTMRLSELLPMPFDSDSLGAPLGTGKRRVPR
jgi:cytidine deaminase